MPKFACMELMWGGVEGAKLEPFLAEIAGLGFDGVALRGATLAPFFKDPAAFRTLLQRHHLALAASYLPVDRAAEWLAPLCEFLPQVGCSALIAHGGQASTDPERRAFAAKLDAYGARAAQFAVQLSYHHHSNSPFETLEQTELLLHVTDPKHVALFLDTGHATQDFAGHPAPTRARLLLERFPHRPRFVEFKAWTPDHGLASELGQGPLDLDAVVDWLVHAGHTRDTDWITLEQNAPTPDQTPAACAARSLAVAKASFARHAMAAR
ncbi:MAG TPA: TIM barrel protein [Planctomycetota bacterium]|nr:TIM barrel protein [Planctomycetota bacterium]